MGAIIEAVQFEDLLKCLSLRRGLVLAAKSGITLEQSLIILGNLRTSDDVIGVLRLTTFFGLDDVTSPEKIYASNLILATVEGYTFLLQFLKNSAKGQVVSSS